jgi:hypothetical protein
VDIEAEAAALLSEGDAASGAAPTTIDFRCPWCDTELHLGVDLAGKKAPCPNPECRRIIDVPKIVQTQKKDWRNVNVGGPSLARRDEGPAPEGAWGSTSASVVSRDALLEAEAVKGKEYPPTPLQRFFMPTLLTVVVAGTAVGVWWFFSWRAANRQTLALKVAVDFAASKDAPDLQAGALHTGAGEYYLGVLRRGTDKVHGSGIDARDAFGKALAALTRSPAGNERDAALNELAVAVVDLGGTGDDVTGELRLKWDEVQKTLRATLAAVNSSEARREGLRAVVRRLLAHGQKDRVLPFTNQLYSSLDADKAEALGVVGLEFLNAGDKTTAAEVANLVLPRYRKDEPPALRASVVALALALDDKPPKPGKGPGEEANALIGKVEGLARQGKWDEAATAAHSDKHGSAMDFRARLALAAVAVDTRAARAAEFVHDALGFVQTKVPNPRDLSWAALRLADLALQISVPPEQVDALAKRVADPALRGRIELAVLQTTLAKGGAVSPDAVEPASLASLLAVQAVARHNVRQHPDWAKALADWENPRRAFASLAVALGLQDRGK